MSAVGAVLGVVVGVAFLFLLLSLIASAAAEVISAGLHLRAAMLDRTMRALLTGLWGRTMPPGAPHEAATTRLLTDPRCQSGFPGMKKRRPQPSYLATPTFVDLIFGHFIAPGAPSAQTVHDAIDKLPNAGIGEVLKRSWADADHDVEQLRLHIGRWYDGAMDRLSGWYKRRIRLILFLLGAVLAFGLNISLFAVGRTLWVDPIARDALITQASQATAPATNPGAGTSVGEPAAVLLDNYSKITNQRLPMGWHSAVTPKGSGWLGAIAGWLIVALGVSMGAPFWFDVLNRFANLRLTGQSLATAAGSRGAGRRPGGRPGPPPFAGGGGRGHFRPGPPPFASGRSDRPYDSDPAGPQGNPPPGGAPVASGPSVDALTISAGEVMRSTMSKFDPAKHGFHFDNHFTNSYEIPFMAGKTITTYGRCGGMAYAALDFFHAGWPIPPATDTPDEHAPLGVYIMGRLIDSWANPSAIRFATWSTKDDEEIKELTDHEATVAMEALDLGQPIPFGLIAAERLVDIGRNHQVVATGYRCKLDGSIEFLLWDNNAHDQTVTLTWHPDRSGVEASNRNAPWRGFFVHSYRAHYPPKNL